ncbi:MAG TPA: di-heme oxidoredictase family protein [Blastocatellia bacterium]|nr:di-heme oxidoredictase family protein [Blastocatellia bacterium]
MIKRITIVAYVFIAAVFLFAGSRASAQLDERPGNSTDNPIDLPRDLSGLSIKNPRVRIVHTDDACKPGGSMYLQQVDPWLGYQWGRSLTQREFRERDGVYGDAGKLDGILLPDGATKIMSRSHTNSCAVCHNTPYRDGGAGATIAKNGGEGRNTPHMFGAGLVEMIGTEIRLRALAIADTNRDGWISAEEAKGKCCVITSGDSRIDYGSFEDLDADGKPDLNELFNPIYVDKNGKRIAFASGLKFPEVAGYTVEVQSFGFGHLYMPFRPPVPSTIRSFIANPFDIHSGLQAFDPTTLNDPEGDGFAQVSNAGALQCITGAMKDRGAVRGPTGISKDDPDRDGYCEEISEGDLDMAEWYLLNHPAPGRGKLTDEVRRGERFFKQVGCAVCHVTDWRLPEARPAAADYTERHSGDRRFFEIQVAYNDQSERLEGKLVSLAQKIAVKSESGDVELSVPRRGAHTVRGIYSDFKYHDLGEAFNQLQFDGSVIRKWRTTPLWGVASTAPYGHDGASLSLDEVIRRHGGEAFDSRKSYASLGSSDRRSIIEFLESLVLYQTDRLPCDLDGDGKISEHFMVGGMDTGYERFNPEWLFKLAGEIEGPIKNLRGERIVSYALENVAEAYGLNLEFLRDTDRDGFPDVIDPAPRKRGYKDGVN